MSCQPAANCNLHGRYGNKNLYILVSGVARRLLREETRHAAFMSLQKLAEIAGPKQFQGYVDRLTVEQRTVYEELCCNSSDAARTANMGNGVSAGGAYLVSSHECPECDIEMSAYFLSGAAIGTSPTLNTHPVVPPTSAKGHHQHSAAVAANGSKFGNGSLASNGDGIVVGRRLSTTSAQSVTAATNRIGSSTLLRLGITFYTTRIPKVRVGLIVLSAVVHGSSTVLSTTRSLRS